jgi:hypothetical protein
MSSFEGIKKIKAPAKNYLSEPLPFFKEKGH